MVTDEPVAGYQRRAFDNDFRPTRVEVDLAALKHNLDLIRRWAGHAEILAVVKANAYGHGALLVSRALEEWGVAYLGVALVEEGLELRNSGIRAPIVVLGGAYEGGYGAMVRHDLTPTVFQVEHVEALAAAAAAAGRTVNAHLKVDTGMGRIGVLVTDLDAFLERAARFPQVRLDGLLSHFANADLGDPMLTRRQVEQFAQISDRLRAKGVQPRWRHISNSAGVIMLPEVRDGRAFNLVRPGIMLYGLTPSEEVQPAEPLRPVFCWKTRVIHLKRVPKGTPISYGSTWVAPRESSIATLPVGYADGYRRHFSNRSQVLIRGRRVPLVGRVCMDLCMVDVTGVTEARVGDEVILLGGQERERITAEELARLAETIHYEILCGVSERVPRIAAETSL